MAAPFFYYLSSFATLEVDNVEVAAAWYSEALGFRAVSRAGDGNGRGLRVHLSRGEDQDLVLVQGRRIRPEHGPVLHFAVDSSLDDLEKRARAAGARVERSPGATDVPEALRVRDPQGYELTFFKRVTPRAP